MWSKWYLLNEKGVGTAIKRYMKLPNGKTKWERFPAKEYRHLSLPEQEAILRRLNVTYVEERRQAEERYNFDHAFVNRNVLDEFHEHLVASANNAGHIHAMMQYLNKYVLEYFVIKMKLPDPKAWKRLENKWGNWLADDQKLAYATIKQVVFNANRFLLLLHEKIYPTEVPMIKLKPLSRNRMKLIKHHTTNQTYKRIKPEVFKQICKKAEREAPHILPCLHLCYKFGVRIGEAIGFQLGDVYSKKLEVARQGERCTGGKLFYKPVKDIDARKVPYWFATADEAYDWISNIPKLAPVTVAAHVNAILRPFGHTSHDMRRSFITQALEQHHWKKVMAAAGHEEIETTLRYDLKDEEEADELYIPNKQ